MEYRRILVKGLGSLCEAFRFLALNYIEALIRVQLTIEALVFANKHRDFKSSVVSWSLPAMLYKLRIWIPP